MFLPLNHNKNVERVIWKEAVIKKRIFNECFLEKGGG
jgi:hypothetical protein